MVVNGAIATFRMVANVNIGDVIITTNSERGLCCFIFIGDGMHLDL
jgi:hypothetical protein